MSREQVESLAAVGLLLLGCFCCWLLVLCAGRVEARSAVRVEQLHRLASIQMAPVRSSSTGQLVEFDGLFGGRTVHRVRTSFGAVLTVATDDLAP